MLSDELKKIFDRYASSLPDKITNIDRLWHAYKANCTPDNVMEFYRAVHNLNGSAGTYGYLDIALIAEKLEVTIKPIMAQPESYTHFESEIVGYIDKLNNCVSSKADETALTVFLQRNSKQ